MASNDLKWPQIASECKDIEKLGLFYKKNIFFKKVVFENFPKYSASNEKLHLNCKLEMEDKSK